MTEQFEKTLKENIREVPDFPKPGINFYDITTVLKNGPLFAETIKVLAKNYQDAGIDTIVGIEARGLIFGAALASELEAGFVPARKAGKLPADTTSVTYQLEYGSDSLEIHKDAVNQQSKVLIVDDLLATGGTASATVDLIQQTNAEIIGCCFLVELCFLAGREKLGNLPITSLVKYSE